MINAILLRRTDIDDVIWDQFVDASPQHSVYCKTWYLDAICPQWMGMVAVDEDKWMGIMPINLATKLTVRYCLQPFFAQYLGVLFSAFDYPLHKILETQKNIIYAMAKRLPTALKIFSYNFHPQFRYFLPFQWKGYTITPRISYHLALDVADFHHLTAQFSSSIKYNIKKAQKKHLSGTTDESAAEVVNMCVANGILNKRKGAIFMQLWAQITARKQGFCLYIRDEEQQLCCGGAFIMDGDKIIFILSSTKNEYRKNGCTAYLLHEALKIAYADPGCRCFDFEGSVIEPIEYFFRGFNPSPVVYFNIRKNKLAGLFSLYQFLKNN